MRRRRRSGTSASEPCCSCCAQNKTVGIVGAGRIGTAYARMMVEGHKCDLVYYDPYPNKFLEEYVRWVHRGRQGTPDAEQETV